MRKKDLKHPDKATIKASSIIEITFGAGIKSENILWSQTARGAGSFRGNCEIDKASHHKRNSTLTSNGCLIRDATSEHFPITTGKIVRLHSSPRLSQEAQESLLKHEKFNGDKIENFQQK